MANSPFILQIDASKLAADFGELAQEVEGALTDAVKLASSMAYAKATELASEKLHSTRKIFQDSLHYEEISPGIWSVSLDEKALWVEDGMSPHSMVDDLLRHNPKISKKGVRYKAIPFEHSKPTSQQSSKAQEITAMVKTELRRRKEPLKKLALDQNGMPKLGRVFHENIMSRRPSKMASHPALHGLSIYQTKNKTTGKVSRDILTFRVVSDKSKDLGKFFYPGSSGAKILDETFDWISQTFDSTILPEVLSKFGK
jgi:hypothetical protein